MHLKVLSLYFFNYSFYEIIKPHFYQKYSKVNYCSILIKEMSANKLWLKLHTTDSGQKKSRLQFSLYISLKKKKNCLSWNQFLSNLGILFIIKSGLFKGIQAVRIEFFVYIKSCQYSMFYTNKMLWTKKPGLKNLL